MRKILKPIMATLAGALLFTKVYSQDSESIIESKKFYYEQGLNITQFVKQYASLNNSNIGGLPYLITGNVGYKKWGVRYGGNYIIDNNSELTPADPNSTNTSSIDENTKTQTGNYRLGLFHSKQFGKRWRLLYGIDYVMSTSTTKTSKNNVTSSSSINSSFKSKTESNSNLKSSTMGGGPFLSIQFFINKNFSIGTESSYYYQFGKITENSNSTNTNTTVQFGTETSTVTVTNFNTTQKSTNAQVFIPSSLFINFRF